MYITLYSIWINAIIYGEWVMGIRQELAKKTREKIVEFLTRVIPENGRVYLKSRYIAEAVGVSSREVGLNLGIITEDVSNDIIVTRYSRSNGTTWLITRGVA